MANNIDIGSCLNVLEVGVDSIIFSYDPHFGWRVTWGPTDNESIWTSVTVTKREVEDYHPKLFNSYRELGLALYHLAKSKSDCDD